MSDRRIPEGTQPMSRQSPLLSSMTNPMLGSLAPPSSLLLATPDFAQTLLAPDDEAEADNFVGQTPPNSSAHLYSVFGAQSGAENDPFSQVAQPYPEESRSDNESTSRGFQAVNSNLSYVPTLGYQPGSTYAEQVSEQKMPSYTVAAQQEHQPSAAQSNPYRISGKPLSHVAQMQHVTSGSAYQAGASGAYQTGPSGAYQTGPSSAYQAGLSSAYQTGPSGAYQTGPSSAYQAGPSGAYQAGPSSAYQAGPSSLYQAGPSSAYQAGPSRDTAPQDSRDYSTKLLHSIHPPQVGAEQHAYEQVTYYWMYCTERDSNTVWLPFSRSDSLKLDMTYNRSGSDVVVSVEGGRYDIDIRQRCKSAAYWNEPVAEVRRCSWFYRAHGDKSFVPYDEQFAARLEENYKNTLLTGDFHKKLELVPGVETVVIHSPQVIQHFSGTSEFDSLGNTSSESRPRAVRRGVSEIEAIPADETSNIDHLVLVVHGIGSALEPKFRSLVDLVNDMRSVANQMLSSHFADARSSGQIGWAEFLPVHYQSSVMNYVSEVNDSLKTVTLGSIGKLRHFTNDTLLDVMFYNSPVHVQHIVNAVSNELNRLRSLFLHRNPSFAGKITLVGHGLGSVVLFDMLSNQSEQFEHCHTQVTNGSGSNLGRQIYASDGAVDMKTDDSVSKEDKLEEILAQLGLSSYLEQFRKEQIDSETLHLFKDEELKELSLPIGPRKKLQDYLRKFQESEKKKESTVQGLTEKRASGPFIRPPVVDSASSHLECRIQGLGVGTPVVTYPELEFTPAALFALSSPLAMFLSMRGVQNLGEKFVLSSCPAFFNIFHPFDPSAYRLEPLFFSSCPLKPSLVPHHKGRKRMHLELKESLVRISSDLKQRFLESVRNTWRSINSFASSHRGEGFDQQQLNDIEVNSIMCDMSEDPEDPVPESPRETSPETVEDSLAARVNQGRRVDYVLQEKPIEMFNDYLFALGSQMCYWMSEDTVLLMLKELYGQTSGQTSGQTNGQTAHSMTSSLPGQNQAAWTARVDGSSALRYAAGAPAVIPVATQSMRGIELQHNNASSAVDKDAGIEQRTVNRMGPPLANVKGPPLNQVTSSSQVVPPGGIVQTMRPVAGHTQVTGLVPTGATMPSSFPVGLVAPAELPALAELPSSGGLHASPGLAAPAPLPTEFLRK